MGILLSVLVAVTSVLTASSSVPDPAADLADIERLVFQTSLPAFLLLADRAADPRFDWTTDLCSAPLVGSVGRSFDFRGPCRRHDFAYRNLKLLDQRYSCPARPPGQYCPPGSSRRAVYWNAPRRWHVDLRFFGDMVDHCGTRSWWDRQRCWTWAQVFFGAVRTAGGP